jgi:hypothetical protein
LAQCFDPTVQAPKALQFRHQLLDFVKNESLKGRPNERLLRSSEIIESVLGKTKRLKQDQSKSGFTGLVLGVALGGFSSAQLSTPRNLPEKWVVDCGHVGKGQPALKYLSRYLYRSVISEKISYPIKMDR